MLFTSICVLTYNVIDMYTYLYSVYTSFFLENLYTNYDYIIYFKAQTFFTVTALKNLYINFYSFFYTDINSALCNNFLNIFQTNYGLNVEYSNETTSWYSKLTIFSYLFTYFFKFIIYYIFIFIGLYIFYDFSKVSRNSKFDKILQLSYLYNLEKEVNSIDDTLYFILTFVIIFSWFFLSIVYSFKFYFFSTNWVFGLLIFVLFSILTIPVNIFLNLKLVSAFFTKGCGNKQNLLIETIFDSINLTIIFIRFCIQNIRFVLIFMAFVELYFWLYHLNLSINLQSMWSTKTTFIVKNIIQFQLLTFFINLLYYFYFFLHLFILILTQTSIYFIITFWLFLFLYSSYFFNKTEIYFLKKTL